MAAIAIQGNSRKENSIVPAIARLHDSNSAGIIVPQKFLRQEFSPRHPLAAGQRALLKAPVREISKARRRQHAFASNQIARVNQIPNLLKTGHATSRLQSPSQV